MRDVPFARPWITDEDRQAVMKVLEGHVLTHGPVCHAFEERFAEFMGDGAHCVTTSSCMASLHLAYIHFGIGPGDEVIAPAQTHVATAHAIEWVGARPVFVDCDPATGNMTLSGIEAALTSKTRAIALVHFVGIPCEMEGIMKFADAHHLKVIEDCALAVGARWKGVHVGLHGDAGCFSFYPVKHMTTAEGGMFASRHADVTAAVAKLRAFGVDRTHGERSLPGMYDTPGLGLNYRMSEIQAALGLSQTARLPEILRRRRDNFTAISDGVKSIRSIRVLSASEPHATSSDYCLVIRLDESLKGRRNEIVLELKARGVGTSVYYPHPVPRMAYYRNKYGYDADRFRGAEAISDQSIALPVGPHLEREDVAHVIDTAREIFGGMNA